MSLRLQLATDQRVLPLLVFGWRLGLGPLLGRRLALVTTTVDGHLLRRTALPYVFADGDLFVPIVGDPSWTDDASRKPQVAVQATPGPLATKARPVTAAESEWLAGVVPTVAADLAGIPTDRWWVLQPTGDPAPPPALPDLNWVWGVVGVTVVAACRRRSR